MLASPRLLIAAPAVAIDLHCLGSDDSDENDDGHGDDDGGEWFVELMLALLVLLVLETVQ